MIRPILLAVIAIATPIGVAQAGSYNRGSDSVHQPVVQRSDYVMDVSGNGLAPAEAGNIRQWFNAIGLGYGDRVSIDTSMGATSSNQDIASIVGSYGMFVHEGAPVTEGAIQPGYVRIIVSRATASVSGCPDYSQWSQPNFTGATSSNFGCGVNSTLAAMVANPEDLVRGQAMQGSSPETATRAIRVWRNADPSGTGGLKVESTKGGN
jgi:pilus assembly protein CpaD